jgi:hypothetical protein
MFGEVFSLIFPLFIDEFMSHNASWLQYFVWDLITADLNGQEQICVAWTEIWHRWVLVHRGTYSNHKSYHSVKNNTSWSESASELYRPSNRRLSAKWLPTCADRGCHMVSVMDPYGRILGFSRQEPLLFYQVAPQLYSRGSVDSVPDPLLFFPGIAGNRTRASGSVDKNSDH